MPLKAGHFSVKIPGQVSVEINNCVIRLLHVRVMARAGRLNHEATTRRLPFHCSSDKNWPVARAAGAGSGCQAAVCMAAIGGTIFRRAR